MTARPPAASGDEVAGFGWVGSLWRGLAPLLRPHRGQLALIGLLMAVELGLQLGQRKAFGTLVDDALLKSDGGLVVLILVLLLAAAIVSGAAALLHERARLAQAAASSAPGPLPHSVGGAVAERERPCGNAGRWRGAAMAV